MKERYETGSPDHKWHQTYDIIVVYVITVFSFIFFRLHILSSKNTNSSGYFTEFPKPTYNNPFNCSCNNNYYTFTYKKSSKKTLSNQSSNNNCDRSVADSSDYGGDGGAKKGFKQMAYKYFWVDMVSLLQVFTESFLMGMLVEVCELKQFMMIAMLLLLIETIGDATEMGKITPMEYIGRNYLQLPTIIIVFIILGFIFYRCCKIFVFFIPSILSSDPAKIENISASYFDSCVESSFVGCVLALELVGCLITEALVKKKLCSQHSFIRTFLALIASYILMNLC